MTENKANVYKSESTTAVSDRGTAYKRNTDRGGEKLFTQGQLEEIISDRLARERRNTDSLSSVKRLLRTVSGKGLLKGSSYSELADELMKRLSPEREDGWEDDGIVEESGEHSRNFPWSDAGADAEDRDFDGTGDGEEIIPGKENDAVCSAEQDAAEHTEKACAWIKDDVWDNEEETVSCGEDDTCGIKDEPRGKSVQDAGDGNPDIRNGQPKCGEDGESGEKREISEQTEAFSENTNHKESFISLMSSLADGLDERQLRMLFSSGSLERFAKGRSGSVSEIVRDYREFITGLDRTSGCNGTMEACTGNAAEIENEEKTDICADEYASTAFCTHSGPASSGAGLTKHQMEIAKSAGMSYREYATLLGSIPRKNSIRK